MSENLSGTPDKFEFVADLEKASLDDDRQIVFGWASVAVSKSGQEIVDREGDIMDLAALEDAAYAFNLHFRETGVDHSGGPVGKLVESIVFTPQKLEALGLAKDATHLGWFVGFHIENDEIWKAVKEKKLRAFSVQGKGLKRDAEKNY